MYAIQKAEKNANIYIYGDIVTDAWFEGETSAHSLVEEIKKLGDVERVDVHIDSYGGSVSEGWAIYNALRQTGAKVRTYGDGFVASAALFPFLAGDERVASSVSAYFLHNVLTYAEGNAEDLRKAADEVEKMTAIGINAFVERAGMTAETVKQLMDNETWLSGKEAFGYGIATEISEAAPDKFAQSVKATVISQMLKKEAEPEQMAMPEVEIEPKKEIEQVIEEEPAEEKTEEKAFESIFDKFKNSIKKGN